MCIDEISSFLVGEDIELDNYFIYDIVQLSPHGPINQYFKKMNLIDSINH